MTTEPNAVEYGPVNLKEVQTQNSPSNLPSLNTNETVDVIYFSCYSKPVQRKRVWEIITGLAMILAIVGEVFTYDAFSAVAPSMIEDGIFTVAQSGYIIGVGHLLYFLGKILTGLATDKVNARNTLIVITVIQGIGSFGLGFSRNLPAVLFFFIVTKLACSGGWPCFTKLIGNWYEPRHYGLAWGVVSTATTICSIFMYNIIGRILLTLNWSWVFWLFAIIFSIISVTLFFSLFNDPMDIGLPSPLLSNKNINNDEEEQLKQNSSFDEGNEGNEPSQPLEIVEESHPLDGSSLIQALDYFRKSPQFWLMMIGLTCITCAAAFEGFITLFLTGRYQLVPGVASQVASAYAAGTMIAVILGGILYSKLSKKGILLLNFISLLICVIDVIILWCIQQVTVEWGGFLIFLFGVGITIPWYYPMSIYSIECGGKQHSGILSGILDGVSNVGTTAFSFAAGYYIENHNWNDYFVLVGCFSLGSLVFMGFFLIVDYKKPSSKKEMGCGETLRVLGFGCEKTVVEDVVNSQMTQ